MRQKCQNHIIIKSDIVFKNILRASRLRAHRNLPSVCTFKAKSKRSRYPEFTEKHMAFHETVSYQNSKWCICYLGIIWVLPEIWWHIHLVVLFWFSLTNAAHFNCEIIQRVLHFFNGMKNRFISNNVIMLVMVWRITNCTSYFILKTDFITGAKSSQLLFIWKSASSCSTYLQHLVIT